MLDDMIDTGIRYCRQKVMLTSTGDKLVDDAIKTMFVREFRRTGANELWRPWCKVVMAWMTKHDAETDAKREQKKRDKYALLEQNNLENEQ